MILNTGRLFRSVNPVENIHSLTLHGPGVAEWDTRRPEQIVDEALPAVLDRFQVRLA